MSDKFSPGPYLRDGALVYALEERWGRSGRREMRIRISASVQRGPDTPEGELEATVELFRSAPDLLAACRKALPIVAAMCNALGETCDEEAADALGSLRDVLALFPED